MNKYEEMKLYVNMHLNWSKKGNENYKLLSELVERATPKKVMFNSENDLQWNVCPSCGIDIEHYVHDQEQELELELKFCPHCGQALKWSE